MNPNISDTGHPTDGPSQNLQQLLQTTTSSSLLLNGLDNNTTTYKPSDIQTALNQLQQVVGPLGRLPSDIDIPHSIKLEDPVSSTNHLVQHQPVVQLSHNVPAFASSDKTPSTSSTNSTSSSNKRKAPPPVFTNPNMVTEPPTRNNKNCKTHHKQPRRLSNAAFEKQIQDTHSSQNRYGPTQILPYPAAVSTSTTAGPSLANSTHFTLRLNPPPPSAVSVLQNTKHHPTHPTMHHINKTDNITHKPTLDGSSASASSLSSTSVIFPTKTHDTPMLHNNNKKSPLSATLNSTRLVGHSHAPTSSTCSSTQPPSSLSTTASSFSYPGPITNTSSSSNSSSFLHGGQQSHSETTSQSDFLMMMNSDGSTTMMDPSKLTPAQRRRYERNLREQGRSQRISQQIKELMNALTEAQVPFKTNKFSVLTSVVQYMGQLQTRIHALEDEQQRLILTMKETLDMDHVHTKKREEEEGDMGISTNMTYQPIFQQCPVALSVAALDGRVLTWNREFQHILGYSPDELSHTSIFHWLDPKDIQGLFQALGVMLKKQEEEMEQQKGEMNAREEEEEEDTKFNHPCYYWSGWIKSKDSTKSIRMNITLARTAHGGPKFINCAATIG